MNKHMRSAGKGVAQCRHFSDRELFRCGRPHFLLQKPTSNFSKFIVCPHGQEEDRERDWASAYIFLDKERSIFHDFVDSLYRVCIKSLWLYHDHLWLLNLMAVLVLWILLGKIYCIVYIFFQSPLISLLAGYWCQDPSSQYLAYNIAAKYTDNNT